MEERRDEKEPFDMRIVYYFVRIMRTIFFGFVWMMINVFLGLYLGLGIPEESTPTRLVCFYTWFVLSLAGLLLLIRKFWKNHGPTQDNYE